MEQIDREQIVRDNRRISIQMEQWANRALPSKELTVVQAEVLRYILRHAEWGTSLTAIHREFGGSMPALSGMLKRLREKGYVRVEHWDGDERRKRLFATEKGEAARECLERSAGQMAGELYRCFSREELITLDRLQKKMLNNLSLLTQTKKEV